MFMKPRKRCIFGFYGINIFTSSGLCKRADQFYERWLGITPRETNVDNEWYPAIMEDISANFNNLGDSFLVLFGGHRM